jgi:hypothetical protein
VEQRGNKLYHHLPGKANSTRQALPRRQRLGMKKPGITRIPGSSKGSKQTRPFRLLLAWLPTAWLPPA